MKKNFISMKKLIIVLVTLLFIPFINSCEDNNEDEITFYDTYIDGYIKDFHTGEPIAGVVFDAKYFDETSGNMILEVIPYDAKNVAVSNSQGYYRIKVPKHGEWGKGDNRVSSDFVEIEVFPRATLNYTFSDGLGYPISKVYFYDEDNLKINNKREEDIRPTTYAYLKVFLPKTSDQGWHFGYYGNSYQTPSYATKLISKDTTSNDVLNSFLFKVPAINGSIKIGNSGQLIPFTIEHPRDTAIINVEQ